MSRFQAHLGFLQVLRTQAREIKPARRGTGGFCAGVGFEVKLGQENGPEGPGSTLVNAPGFPPPGMMAPECAAGDPTRTDRWLAQWVPSGSLRGANNFTKSARLWVARSG